MIRIFLIMLCALAPLSLHAGNARWKDNGNQTLTDTFTGLVWTRHDNLKDVDWGGAKRYCDTLGIAGGHWRLPDVDELAAIHGDGRDGSTACAPPGWNESEHGPLRCQVSSLFHLTGAAFWSATLRRDSSEAWGVALAYGGRISAAVSDPHHARALCVRGS